MLDTSSHFSSPSIRWTSASAPVTHLPAVPILSQMSQCGSRRSHCRECDRSFTDRQALIQHDIDYHYYCSLCKKNFRKRKAAKHHAAVQHWIPIEDSNGKTPGRAAPSNAAGQAALLALGSAIYTIVFFVSPSHN